MKKGVFFCLLLVSALATRAQIHFIATAPTGQALHYLTDGTDAIVISPDQMGNWSTLDVGYIMPSGSMVIPATVVHDSVTYTVRSVQGWAFKYCSGLTCVTLPSTIRSIGSGAFFRCTGIIAVTMGDSVTDVGYRAFSGCGSLSYLTLSASLSSIGDSAFNGCHIASLNLPSSLTHIGVGAFYNCSRLSSLSMGGTPTIGRFAFARCTSLSSVYYNGTLGDWCQIGFQNAEANPLHTAHHLFVDSTVVRRLAVPSSVARIGDYAFAGCTDLRRVAFGTSVAAIGRSAFAGCDSLARVEYSGTLADWCGIDFADSAANPLSAAQHLYVGGKELFRLSVPDSVASVGRHAFVNGRSISRLTLGKGIAHIGAGAFSGMSRLAAITCKAAEPPYVDDAGAFDAMHYELPVTIPCDAAEAYQYAYAWGRFADWQEAWLHDFDVSSADTLQGIVEVSTQPSCSSWEACFQAVARTGYRFDHWSDGSLANPRYLVAQGDTAVAAFFAPDGSQGIGTAASGTIVVSTIGTRIVVEGLANEVVRLFDCQGRCLQSLSAAGRCTLQAPAAGIYLLQVGSRPARRVAVVE